MLYYWRKISKFVNNQILMAKDFYHELVKEALEAEGWTITHDPYSLDEWDPEWETDLGAEKVIGARKDAQKIAVEVKSFLDPSPAHQFHKALGQYLNYIGAIENLDKDRVLYLAVPLKIWNTEFQRHGIRYSIEKYAINILIYNIESKNIEEWKTFH